VSRCIYGTRSTRTSFTLAFRDSLSTNLLCSGIGICDVIRINLVLVACRRALNAVRLVQFERLHFQVTGSITKDTQT
jgi:hypothetical protein